MKASGEKNEEVKPFSDKQKLRELVITGPALPKMLKGVLQIKTLNSTMDGI